MGRTWASTAAEEVAGELNSLYEVEASQQGTKIVIAFDGDREDFNSAINYAGNEGFGRVKYFPKSRQAVLTTGY